MRKLKLYYNYSISSGLASIVILFIATCMYLYVLIACARFNVAFEIVISLFLPIVIIGMGLATKFTQRVKQIFFIESFYNVLAISGIIFFLLRLNQANYMLSYAFVVFFLIQFAGFLSYQIKFKKYISICMSVILLSFILCWFLQFYNHNSIVDNKGRFLMWGNDAPLSVKIIYSIWALNPILVDSRVLPKLTQATVQLASISLCWFSGQFFHVRLFTACHLFMLDGILGYTASDFGGTDFCIIPADYQKIFFKRVQPGISFVSIGAIMMVVIASMFWGFDLNIK